MSLVLIEARWQISLLITENQIYEPNNLDHADFQNISNCLKCAGPEIVINHVKLMHPHRKKRCSNT